MTSRHRAGARSAVGRSYARGAAAARRYTLDLHSGSTTYVCTRAVRTIRNHSTLGTRCSRSEVSGSDGLAAQPARAVQTATATAATGVPARGRPEAVPVPGPRRWRRRPRSAQTTPADQQPVHQQLLRCHRRRHSDRR